jgi:hypothetical protein
MSLLQEKYEQVETEKEREAQTSVGFSSSFFDAFRKCVTLLSPL